MLLSLAKLAASFIQAGLELLRAGLNWIKEHPRTTLAFTVAVVLMVVTFKLTVNYTEKKVWAEANIKISKLQTELDKANRETEARNLKIAKLESDSTTFAEDMAKRLEDANAQLRKTVGKYEARLSEEKAKAKEGGRIVYVNVPGDPGPPIEVEVRNREVVCSKFSDAFLNTVNEIIDIANQPINLKTSMTLSSLGA